jgi:hypothetical protein
MDKTEFEETEQPNADIRSRLAPYWEDILSLRSKGYSLAQVVRFLGANGVTIGISGLSAYIKRRQQRESKSGVQVADQISQKQLKLPAQNASSTGLLDKREEAKPTLPVVEKTATVAVTAKARHQLLTRGGIAKTRFTDIDLDDTDS